MSSTDGSDDEIARPRGRIARRMLAIDDEDSNADMSSPTKPARNTARSTEIRAANMSEQNQELYYSTPAKTRRQAPTRQHASSPANTPLRESSGVSLFVSPCKSNQVDSDDDKLPIDLFTSKHRLAELIEQKRLERESREADAAQERQKSRSTIDTSSDEIDHQADADAAEDNTDPEVERIMSDAVRPARKASKKALLEMERETQRLAREQALAHQMKVKKKFTTSDLFTRFDYHPPTEAVQFSKVIDETFGSSIPNSDASEPRSHHELASTPPSSPPTPLDRQRALVEKGALSKLMPVREDSLTTLAYERDNGLADITDVIISAPPPEARIVSPTKTNSERRKGFKLGRLGKEIVAATEDEDSGSDLEIVYEGTGHQSIFEKAKGTMRRQNADSNAIHTLKHLSHIGADFGKLPRGKKVMSRPSVPPQVLQNQLRARAREQAHTQQLERIAELKAKGIVILTAEEREKEAEAYENLLDKAREEAQKLRKAEKAAAREAKDNDEANAEASADESEDEDYDGGSATEEETEQEEDEQEEDEQEDMKHGLLSNNVEESDEDDAREEERQQRIGAEAEDEDQVGDKRVERELEAARFRTADHDGEEVGWVGSHPIPRPRRPRVIEDDEEEEDMDTAKATTPATLRPSSYQEEEDDPFAVFGFKAGHKASSLMSPTQAFNATMQTPTQLTQESSLHALQNFAPPTFALAPVPFSGNPRIEEDSPTSVTLGSQVPESQRINLVRESQAPGTPVPLLNRGDSALSLDTPGWEPTQDDGHQISWRASGMLGREDTLDSTKDNETQSTVRLRISESPASVSRTRTRNRLVRGRRVATSSDEEDGETAMGSSQEKKDVFREMKRRRREMLSAAEKAQAEREAKDMMDEQAEESEDEYAGLGGDDYIAPETAEDREIIDSGHIDVDERALAAHFAEQERVEDEAKATRLYKDLITGNLRRKQANLFGLDDDEDDLALRRRQMKQREEARKRRLLLQDDNIANLAEGKPSKGKDAFLKAIADDDDDANEDMAEHSDEDTKAGSQQTQSTQIQEGEFTDKVPLQETTGNKRRRADDNQERLPATKRRTQASAFRAPASMLEVRASVSFLLDDRNASRGDADPGQDEPACGDDENAIEQMEKEREGGESDDDDLQLELMRNNDGGFAPDRELMPPPRLPASMRRTAARTAVVDRLSFKRSASTSDRSSFPTAWAAPGGSGFSAPTLLRRATTQTAFAVKERGVTTSNGMNRENTGVKIGGSKKSSLAYQARAEERRAVVEASAKRRADNTARIAQLRRAVSAPLGRELSGSFESS